MLESILKKMKIKREKSPIFSVDDLVSVQPMTRPTGAVFQLEFKYQSFYVVIDHGGGVMKGERFGSWGEANERMIELLSEGECAFIRKGSE